MVGFMNEEAFEKTKQDQRVTFWSRTKGRLWQKGEESGHFLNVVEMSLDCDEDTLLILAKPEGPTCHTGARSCFSLQSRGIGFLGYLFGLIESRRLERPKGAYTTALFEGGLPAISAKVEEEAEEVVRAAREETDRRVAEEASDVLYHLWVLLAVRNISLKDVVDVLEERHGL
jgi:phosphoribosyl-ATP pyrophosphohydrolase/phosphoribosyl-AMP cyclohydrolase